MLRMPRTNSEPKGNTYHVHRGRQRRRILSAAEKLFDERGIDRTTMAEVIAASELRPSTVYQYFSNKDDIVWAILGEIMADAAERARQSISGAANGLATITALLEYMADELSLNQSKIRFMAQFDAMYARDWPAERLLTLEGQIDPQGFKAFGELGPGGHRRRVSPPRPGSGSDVACRDQCGDRSAAAPGFPWKQGRVGIRAVDRSAVSRDDSHYVIRSSR